MANTKSFPTTTSFLARECIVAPVDRQRRKNTHWIVDKNQLHIDIDDMLTEKDIDLLEWLFAYGNPTEVREGIGFKFSLYAAAKALGQGRTRIRKRIERRQKTLVTIRDGVWEAKGQVFGPSLRNLENGEYLVSITTGFAKLWNHGMLIYYDRFLDDILPIASPIVRRLVRRALSHDFKPSYKLSLDNFLNEIRFAVDATQESKRKMRKAAIDDILAASEYLQCVFGIEVLVLRGGQPGIQYTRDKNDDRLFIKTADEPTALSNAA